MKVGCKHSYYGCIQPFLVQPTALCCTIVVNVKYYMKQLCYICIVKDVIRYVLFNSIILSFTFPLVLFQHCSQFNIFFLRANFKQVFQHCDQFSIYLCCRSKRICCYIKIEHKIHLSSFKFLSLIKAHILIYNPR